MATTKLSVSIFAVIAALALFQSAVAQTTHVVGGALGWTIPQPPAAYATWASGKTFAVGDVLVFNYPTGAHDVAEVNKAAYDGCSSTNPISMITTGPTRITLKASGDHYFFCTFPGHCGTGQKLSINVQAPPATPPATAPPSPPTSMAPAATPPTTVPTTPTTSMPPAATPPAAVPPNPTTSMPPAATPTPTPTTAAPTPSPASTTSPPSPSPAGTTSPSGMATPPAGMQSPSPSSTNPSTPAPAGTTPAPPQDNSASSFAAVAVLPAALLSIALVLLN